MNSIFSAQRNGVISLLFVQLLELQVYLKQYSVGALLNISSGFFSFSFVILTLVPLTPLSMASFKWVPGCN